MAPYRTTDRLRPMPAAPPLRRTAPPLLGGLLVTLTAVAQPTDLSNLDLRVTPADIQPSVTIEEYENRTVERYSVNNNTYMLKVTPNVGAPYYLVDEDGSGDMAWRRNTPGMHTQVPQWTLFSW